MLSEVHQLFSVQNTTNYFQINKKVKQSYFIFTFVNLKQWCKVVDKTLYIKLVANISACYVNFCSMFWTKIFQMCVDDGGRVILFHIRWNFTAWVSEL